jgi:hypothetical protein
MESVPFLFLIISGVHAWVDAQCSGADICYDHTVLQYAEDDTMVSLLQRRAFLERPQVDVEDGMLVAVHSVSAIQETKPDDLEHDFAAANLSLEIGQLSSSVSRENRTRDPASPAASSTATLKSKAVEPAAEPASSDLHPAEQHADRLVPKPSSSARLSLVETRSALPLDVLKNAIVGIHNNISSNAGGNGSSGNDTDDNSTEKLIPTFGGAHNDVEEKLQAAENVSQVEMKTLATLIVEAIILFIAETCRRIWFVGAVEASTDARLAVLSFPFLFWILRWSCGSSKRTNQHADSTGHNSGAAEEPDRQLTKPHGAEMKEAARCVFETVGCALERTGHQGCGETVAFRYLALNASGLAYAALGRPTKSGRWRIEMLETLWPSSKDGEDASVDLLPLLESILLGVVHEQDVNTASDELGGHWAFVSADRGRGFAYSPAGRAVRRGVETPCAAVTDPRSDVLELVLDAPRRAFEVFCVRESSRELICSFEGIRPGRYLLAVSLRTGSIKVAEMSSVAAVDESSS